MIEYLWCGLNGAQEERHKPGQAVLVHGVHASQVSNAEEEQAGSDSHRAVLLPGSVNLLLGAFSLFNFAGYVIASSLQKVMGRKVATITAGQAVQYDAGMQRLPM